MLLRSPEVSINNLIKPETASIKPVLSRRRFLRIGTLAIAGVACNKVEATGIRLFLPYAPRDSVNSPPPPTATPDTRPTATPTPESLESRLERFINTYQTTDSAQEILNGKNYTFKIKIDPQAKYKFTMRADLKPQAMHLIAIDGSDHNFNWDITFDEATILCFARHQDIPNEIFHGDFPQGYTREDGTKQASGFFGAKGSININGKKYVVVVFAPPENGLPFDAENVKQVGATLGLNLASATIRGYGPFDPSRPRLTREQLLKFDERDPIFQPLNILSSR